MDVELRFNKGDTKTKKWLKTMFNLSDNDFLEIRSFDGTGIMLAVIIAIEVLIKKPEIIDKFLKRDGCEVEFDEQGNLLRAKGYSASDIIRMTKIKQDTIKTE